MTFNKLHDGLDYRCTDQPGVETDTSSRYVRAVNHQYVCVHEFSSYAELGKSSFFPKPSKRQECMRRTVSIYLLNGNEKQIRQHLEVVSGISRMYRFPFVCVFRLKTSEVVIWDTGNAKNPSHRSLMKPDNFDLNHMDLISVMRTDDL